MNLLSSTNRDQALAQLSEKNYDLLVIGGGITGAGIALDAASRGLSVALIEKSDFAAGTSSKSTKLIHGGLRYLKQFEINLVREVGRERAIVHRLAPHLVTAEKMLLPLIKGGTYSGLATSVGLWVYDLLAGVKGEDKRRMLNKTETLKKEPLLREDILTGSGLYAEYRTDDARLTIEIIKTARQYGATCLNYVAAEDFVYDQNGKITAVRCLDRYSGQSLAIDAQYVVSAAGPWVDKLRKKDDSLRGKHLFLSKGVHIVVSRERLPIRQAVYFDVPDGRMVFAIPRLRATYIGTTDTPYEGDLNDIPINQEDVDYLLEAANNMFPSVNLTNDDVESSWAGLRPLIHEEGKSPSEMSRRDELFESETGLISIAGGKLTGYRKMAERVVDLVTQKFQQQNGKSLKANRTAQIPLTGGPFQNRKEIRELTAQVEQQLAGLGLEGDYAPYLIGNYGKQSREILDKMAAINAATPEEQLARAEAWYAIHHELALYPMDLLNRRTGRLYFNLPSIEPVMDAVIEDFKTTLNWDETRTKTARESVFAELRKASEFAKSETAHV